MQTDAYTMNPTHPLWELFDRMLSEAIAEHGCCKGPGGDGVPLARSILSTLAETEPLSVTGSLLFFEHCGGYCDCEIRMNVAGVFADEQQRAAS